MPLMNREEIEKVIPHRDPFMLIDTVEELEPGKRVVATKHIDAGSFWFKGHFPGYPVTPGVLIVEMLAQAGAVCALSLPENKGKLAMFAGIDKAKFRRQVEPGDTLLLEVELLKMRKSFGSGLAKATVNGERAVSCEITFALVDGGAQRGAGQ